MHVRNLGYPIPIQIWAQNHLFSTTLQLNSNLTAYIFGMKHDIHKGLVRCKLQGASYILSKRHEL